MDGAKFVKFARDCHIIDKKITTTDIDIIFNKVKEKGERKINFEQFQKALPLLAKLSFPKLNNIEADVALTNKIIGSEVRCSTAFNTIYLFNHR